MKSHRPSSDTPRVARKDRNLYPKHVVRVPDDISVPAARSADWIIRWLNLYCTDAVRSVAKSNDDVTYVTLHNAMFSVDAAGHVEWSPNQQAITESERDIAGRQ